MPYIHHADIIKSAIKFKKHFVSTSYVSPAMMALDEQYVQVVTKHSYVQHIIQNSVPH